ncbi:class I SAM-dependent methyltransferase [Candidatus Pseudothioglobus singularis]|nr:class I SAM-dependent methyltransferase [Candidatus Pseudothioglobus singularis]MDB4847820.1 class I SAM-dependent methyltransferase [Candidatus Pseudothioglobus singularis]
MFECRGCGGENLEMVLDLGIQPWGNHFQPTSEERDLPKYPLEFYICKSCWLGQIGYTVPKEVMFVNHGYVSGTTQSLRGHFKEIVNEIVTKIDFMSDDYVLDIGGNDGTFLQEVKRHQVDVLNVDSGDLQAKRSEEAGVPCLNEFFNLKCAERIIVNRGKARIIHASGILFHLEELHSVLDGIKSILDDDGYLVAEFIYLPKMIENCAFDQIYHEHLVYYTLHSLSRLLEIYGLKLVDSRIDPIHGGSCIAWITHITSNESQSNNLIDLMEREKQLMVEDLEIYRNFSKRVSKLKNDLNKVIDQIRSEGKKIQALGAPVKGSTIINYCNIDSDRVECAVEINELKVGSYIPGTTIPVKFQNTTVPPDVYLLLAWNFEKEILKKLEGFRQSGGKFLIPIPHPVII